MTARKQSHEVVTDCRLVSAIVSLHNLITRQRHAPLSGFSPSAGLFAIQAVTGGVFFRLSRAAGCGYGWLLLAWMAGLLATPSAAVILWNDPGVTLAHENGAGVDILGGAVKRDDSANDTLYFKFHVDPWSDKDTEEYFAGFELYEGDTERLGIGNSLKAWAYSAFFHADETGESNNPSGYFDLRTSKPESATSATSATYQYPRRGVGVTIGKHQNKRRRSGPYRGRDKQEELYPAVPPEYDWQSRFPGHRPRR